MNEPITMFIIEVWSDGKKIDEYLVARRDFNEKREALNIQYPSRFHFRVVHHEVYR